MTTIEYFLLDSIYNQDYSSLHKHSNSKCSSFATLNANKNISIMTTLWTFLCMVMDMKMLMYLNMME